MIIEGNITIGSSVTIASNAVPYGDAVFFANTSGVIYSNDILNGPRYSGTANATYKWIVPSGVTSISVLCIGGGGAGGGGGATINGRMTAPTVGINGRYWSGSGGGGGGLVYGNNIPVVPGTEYIIQVGGGGQKRWQAYDSLDPDFGSITNDRGRPTAFNGGPSFFTTNAAIIAKQTAMVIANGGTAGKANINCINGTGTTNSLAIYSLLGGGGGGAGGYKGAGGAGGNGGTPNQISGGSGGTTAGTKKTAGFSGGAGGGASWVDNFTSDMIGDFLPLPGKNPAVNSGAGAGGSAEVVSNKAAMQARLDMNWQTGGSQIGQGPTAGGLTGAYGGGGVGIYGAGQDGKISSMLYPDNSISSYNTATDRRDLAVLATFKNCSGSGGADNRYDQTQFDYFFSQSSNVPGSAIPVIPRLMSRGASFGGGGGSPFSHCYSIPTLQSPTVLGQTPIQGVGNGGPGVVRIVWPGQLRQFPNTRVQQIDHGATSAADDNFIDVELLIIGGGGGGGGGYRAVYSYSPPQYVVRGGGGGGAGGVVMKRLRVRPGDILTVQLGGGGSSGYYSGGIGNFTTVLVNDQVVAEAFGGGGGGYESGANNVASAIASAGGGAGGGSPGYDGYSVQGHPSTSMGYGNWRSGIGGGGAGGVNDGPRGGPSGNRGPGGGGGGAGAPLGPYGSYESGGRSGYGGAGEGAGYVQDGYRSLVAEGGYPNTGGGGGGGSGALISYPVWSQTEMYGASGGSGKVVLYINDIEYQHQAWSGAANKIVYSEDTTETPVRIISLLESGTITF